MEYITFLAISIIYVISLIGVTYSINAKYSIKRIFVALNSIAIFFLGIKFFLLTEDYHIIKEVTLYQRHSVFYGFISFSALISNFLVDYSKKTSLGKIVISNFMYIFGILIISINNIIALVISIEFIWIFSIFVNGIGINSSFYKYFYKKFFIGLFSSALGILFLCLIIMSTRIELYKDILLLNQEVYSLSLAILLIYFLIKIGVFPFSGWKEKLYYKLDASSFASEFLIFRSTLIYSFIIVMRFFLKESTPLIYNIVYNAIVFICIFNILIAFFDAYKSKNIKKQVLRLSSVQTSYLVLSSCILGNNFNNSSIVYSLVFMGAGYVLANITISRIQAEDKASKLSVASLIVSLFTISCAPFSAGFFSMYFVLSMYFADNFLLEGFFLIIAVIGSLFIYIKYVSRYFSHNKMLTQSNNNAIFNFSTDIVQLLLLLTCLLGGVLPKFFL